MIEGKGKDTKKKAIIVEHNVYDHRHEIETLLPLKPKPKNREPTIQNQDFSDVLDCYAVFFSYIKTLVIETNYSCISHMKRLLKAKERGAYLPGSRQGVVQRRC